MKLRSNSGGTNELSKKTIYCRMCGYKTKALETPDFCVNCGNIEGDEGFGISGDAGQTETTTTVKGISVINVTYRKRK